MNKSNEEITLADRFSTYADAVTAFSVVNAFAFLISIADPDVRCAFTDSFRLMITIFFGLQLSYIIVIWCLRNAELKLRQAGHQVSPPLVNQYRRYLFVARISFTTFVGVFLGFISMHALNGSGC